MSYSEVSIHLMGKKAPEVIIEEYSGFWIIKIDSDPKIKFFIYSRQEAINFKNNLLWASERPVKMG